MWPSVGVLIPLFGRAIQKQQIKTEIFPDINAADMMFFASHAWSNVIGGPDGSSERCSVSEGDPPCSSRC